MKTIYALVFTLLVGSVGSALAQPANPKHMLEFNADSILQGVLSLDRNKSRGTKADNDTQLQLDLNYAYALPAMPQLQLGGRINYQKGAEGGRGDFEDYGFQAGVIYNLSPSLNEADLMNSVYASLYLGLGWNNNYTEGIRKDEVLSSTVAIGKRISLSQWGMNHVVYSPEIALQSLNSTTGGALEYSQSIQLRFLQFSVFF